MSKIKYLILLIFIKLSLFSPLCEVEKNHCSRCNPITKLCVKCDKDIYIPNENGGCQNAKKCIFGFNNCMQCNEKGNLCEKCLDGYELNEEGYCVDFDHCEEKEGDSCKKCKKEWIDNDVHYYCYNSIFGCIRSYNRGCLKCEDLDDLYFCTECEPGYELTIYGNCKEIY